jgi:hypothetical protein
MVGGRNGAQVRELFRNDLRFISAINVLGLPAAEASIDRPLDNIRAVSCCA